MTGARHAWPSPAADRPDAEPVLAVSAPGITWRVEVALPLAAVATIYLAGWTRLAIRSPARCRPRLMAGLALALVGLTAVAVALLGLHEAAHESFAAHMVQHLLLIAIAMPALLLADPLPAVLWALPARRARRLGRALAGGRRCAVRGARSRACRSRGRCYAAALWLWHVPVAYDAALATGCSTMPSISTLRGERRALLVARDRPRAAHGAAAPLGARIVYLVLGAFQSAALGVFLLVEPRRSTRTRHRSTTRRSRTRLGGVVMWGVGGAVDMAAVLFVVYRFLAGRRARFLDRPRTQGENESVRHMTADAVIRVTVSARVFGTRRVLDSVEPRGASAARPWHCSAATAPARRRC